MTLIIVSIIAISISHWASGPAPIMIGIGPTSMKTPKPVLLPDINEATIRIMMPMKMIENPMMISVKSLRDLAVWSF